MILRRDNRKKHQWEVALIATLAIGAFVLLYPPARLAFTGLVYRTAPGIWETGKSISSAWTSLRSTFHLKVSLLHENEVLHSEVERMQALVLDRNLLEERVLKLEEMLGRTVGDDRVAAEVLAVPGWSPYDTLVLDVGTDNGIAIGDRVVYAGRMVVGEIVEVYSSSAKAKLYSSSGEERTVVIGAQAVPGTAHGRGMGNFEVMVPQGSAVAIGDEVRTPEGSFILGVVGVVEEKIAEPTTRVLFRSPWNIAQMRSVEVVLGKR